jgi:hypothetical protein
VTGTGVLPVLSPQSFFSSYNHVPASYPSGSRIHV